MQHAMSSLRPFLKLLAWAVPVAVLMPAAAAQADSIEQLASAFEGAVEGGSWTMALGIIFLAGVATSLTPCVYPMIVIPVSVFGARQAESKVQAAKLSAAFVLGIATLFTPMGVVAAMTGGVFGAALANPIVLGVLAAIFLALAASMFGAFDLDLPSGLKNRLAMAGGVGVKGAFVLGLVNSLIAAPCTGPVVGFLLTWVGTSQNVVFGALAFFTYSIGLGLLFFMVGTFSMGLPKSGAWLEHVKSVFGVVMVAAAIYFVRDLIPGLTDLAERTPRFLGIGAALVVVGIAIGAIHLSFHHTPVITRVRKGLGVAAAVAGCTVFVLYLEALPPGAKLKWLDDYEGAKQMAMTSGKPLLVDFGASWCGACGELDRHTFADPRVVKEGQRFIPVKIDLSPGKDTPEKQELLTSYSHKGLPLVVLHHTTGEEAARVTNFVPAERFLEIMRTVQ